MFIVPVQREGESLDPAVFGDVDATLIAEPDPWKRAQRASHLINMLCRLSDAVVVVRRAAIRELVEQQYASKALVARQLGVSAARVHQLLSSDRPTNGGAL